MKAKLFSAIFSVLALAVLMLGFASAVPDPCLSVSPISFPSSVVNNQGTFQATFNLVHSSGNCDPRTISAISLSSSTGSWSNASAPQALPFTIDDNTNNPILVTSTFTIPQSASGALTTNVAITSNTTSTNYLTTLPLPNVTITVAPSNLSITAPTTIINKGQNATLTVTNNGNTALLSVIMSEIGSTLFGVTFNPATFSLGVGPSSATVTAILSNLNNLKFGLNTVQVQAAAGTQTATASFQVKKTFCSNGQIGGNLSIPSVDIQNDGEGDENTWELLDEIDIEVEVENNNQDDERDLIVRLGLFDSSGSNLADDLDYLPESDGDEDEIKVRVDEDDKETVHFIFKVPADFDAENYKLAIKVFDDDISESIECKDNVPGFSAGFYDAISVERTDDEGKSVVVDDIELDSATLTCGETLSGEFTVFNVGDDDQDRVRITAKNTELGINEQFEITSDLDEGDDQRIPFSFLIPATAENKQHRIDLIVEYGYDDGVFEDEADDTFPIYFNVAGCSSTGPITGPPSGILITASLESDAAPGEELVVEATITNAGSSSQTLTISAEDFEDWASLDDTSRSSLTLDAGESEKVTFTFTVDEDAEGSQSFDIKVTSPTETTRQTVEVNLEEPASTGKKFNFNLKGNPLIWLIGIINVILILLIIMVAVKVARR